MATDWSKLTPEKRAEINEKRKHKYRQLPEEQKAAIQAKDRAKYTKVTKPETWHLNQEDGKVVTITDPEMVQLLNRLDLKVRRRKAAFNNRIEKIQEWVKAGGLYPSPNIREKMDVTEMWAKIAHILGRRCSHCGDDSHTFDFSWRITRKDDFLAFVHFTRRDYQRVLLRPQDYCLYCLHCAFDLRFYTFCWLFSPYSNRNRFDPANPTYIAGPKYRDWDTHIWRAMYPANPELFRRIRQGYIKSLTCGIKGPDGNFLPTFLRKNQYYGWVGLQPRDLSPIIMAKVAEYYKTLYPDTDTNMWGIGKDFNDNNRNDIDISDDLKRFLKETPPGWQKQRSPKSNPNPPLNPAYSITSASPIPASTIT